MLRPRALNAVAVCAFRQSLWRANMISMRLRGKCRLESHGNGTVGSFGTGITGSKVGHIFDSNPAKVLSIGKSRNRKMTEFGKRLVP